MALLQNLILWAAFVFFVALALCGVFAFRERVSTWWKRGRDKRYFSVLRQAVNRHKNTSMVKGIPALPPLPQPSAPEPPESPSITVAVSRETPVEIS